MKEDKMMNKIWIEKFIKDLERKEDYDDDVLKMIKDDLEYGLTEKQIEVYYKKKISIEKMQIYSKCLRSGYSDDVMNIITAENLSANQMSIAYEFYEKGVSIDNIEKIVNKNETAMEMRLAYEEILKKMQNVKDDTETQEPEYVKKLFGQIKDVVSKINYQEEMYNALNNQLKIFETTKEDEQFREKLILENEKKERIINDQQDNIMKANSSIARYRENLEKQEEKVEKLQNKIDTLENIIEKNNEYNILQEKKEVEVHDKEMTNEDVDKEKMTISDNDIKMELLPIQIENMKEKSNRGIIGTLSSLIFKKKSRRDMVKLVIKRELMPDQLIQVKTAIERGLTENQLVELINNNISAEHMKEIIEIAVLENSLQ